MENPKLVIHREEDFLWALYHRIGPAHVFPRVSSIPKGKRITPDIDLLQFKPYLEPPELIGYEVKVLQPNDYFGPFYAALGQALCYFRYGLDRVYVVVGCHKLQHEQSEDIATRLQETWKFLRARLSIPSALGFQIMGVYPQIAFHDYNASKKPFTASSKFVHIDQDPLHKRNCLFNEEFEWARAWAKKRSKSSEHGPR